MLQKRLRLKRNEDFSKVFRFGKPFYVREIACKAVIQNDKQTLVGFSFSKKLFPKASKRNRVKRLFSDVIEKKFDLLPTGVNIVFYYTRRPNKTVYRDISADIVNILSFVAKMTRN